MIDVDDLPPVQTLVLEVLAARTRLGEHFWTLPSNLRHHLGKLADAGLIEWSSSSTRDAVRAWLTDAGRDAVLLGDYALPDPIRQRDEAQALLAKVAELAMGWPDERGDQLMRLLTEKEPVR